MKEKVDTFKKVLSKAKDPALRKHLKEKIDKIENNKTVLK